MKNIQLITLGSLIIFFFGLINCFAQEKIELEEIKIDANKKLKNSVQYKELKKMPELGVYSFGFAIEEDMLYVMSGDVSNVGTRTEYKGFSDKIYVYNFNTDYWRTLNLKSSTVANNTIINHEGKLYSFGGRKVGNNRTRELLNNKIDIYDIKNDTMLLDDVMAHQAVNAAIVKVDDKVLFFGGSTKKYNNNRKFYTNKVSMYNLSNGYWYELDPMPEAKESPGILVDGKIYLIGGDKNQPLKDIESFDLTSGKWTKEFELPIAMSKPSIAKKEHIIYIYENGVFYTFDTYNKILKEYTINNILSDNSQIFIHDDHLYILGGIVDNSNSVNRMYRLNLKEFNNTKVKRELRIKSNS